MKYFRMSYEEVVFNRSYINIILLNRSIPSMDLDKEEEGDVVEGGKRLRGKYRNESELFSSLM